MEDNKDNLIPLTSKEGCALIYSITGLLSALFQWHDRTMAFYGLFICVHAAKTKITDSSSKQLSQFFHYMDTGETIWSHRRFIKKIRMTNLCPMKSLFRDFPPNRWTKTEIWDRITSQRQWFSYLTGLFLSWCCISTCWQSNMTLWSNVNW